MHHFKDYYIISTIYLKEINNNEIIVHVVRVSDIVFETSEKS